MHFHDHELFHSHRRRGWGIAMHVALAAVLAAAIVLLFGLAVQYLWNAVMPGLALASASRLDFWHAVGLLLLARILVGGFHRGGLFGGRRHWGHREDWRQYEDWWREVGHKSFAEFTAAAPPKEPGS